MTRPRPLFDAKRVLAEALARWELPAVRVRVVSDRTNLVFRVEPDGAEPAVLRLIHSDRRSREQVEAELRFVAHLDEQGVHVAAGQASRNGQLVETVEARQGSFSASLLGWAPGRRVTYRSRGWSDDLLRAWGRVTGQVHQLSMQYEPKDDVPERFAWSDDDVWSKARVHLPPHEGMARDQRIELEPRLENLPRTPSTYGLIHGDLTGASFRVSGDRLTVFDFDDCCQHWFAYDLAVALWGYRLLTPDERARLLNVWLTGYREHMQVDPLWLEAWNTFFELRALYLLARSYRDYGDDAVPDRQRRARNGWRRMLEQGFEW